MAYSPFVTFDGHSDERYWLAHIGSHFEEILINGLKLELFFTIFVTRKLIWNE